jgi:hypothetical protein
MDIEVEPKRNVTKFNIECIEKSDPPKDMTGDNWYRYIVMQNGRKITGFKTGSLKSVTEHVESFTQGLNERSIGGVSPNARSARTRK